MPVDPDSVVLAVPVMPAVLAAASSKHNRHDRQSKHTLSGTTCTTGTYLINSKFLKYNIIN